MTFEVKASIHQVLGTVRAKALMGTRRIEQDQIAEVTGARLECGIMKFSFDIVLTEG